MSFVNLTLMSLSIAFIRTRPTSPEATRARGPLFNKTVFTHSEFWSIAMSLVIGCLGYGTPMTFLNSWVKQHFPSMSPMALSGPLIIMAFSVTVGRAMIGMAADKLGAINTYIFVLVFSGVVQLGLWLTAKSYVGICMFAVMYGLIAPGYLGILPQIVVTLFGPNALASNVGILLLFNAPGNLVAGPLGGAIYDASGRTTFSYMIVTMGCLQILGGVVACWARFRTSSSLLARV
jgi:predicted MFS family arabinose efflux permease